MTYNQIIKFHGHECPGVTIGYRMTKAALKVLNVSRAEDEELVAIVENDACGVDALQCLTGCTFGKGNLIFHDYGKQVYTVYSRKQSRAVRVLFHGRGIPEEIRNSRADMTRWLKSAPTAKIISVENIPLPEPPAAMIKKSVKCAFCGENTMETRIKQCHGKPACIPCSEKNQ